MTLSEVVAGLIQDLALMGGRIHKLEAEVAHLRTSVAETAAPMPKSEPKQVSKQGRRNG